MDRRVDRVEKILRKNPDGRAKLKEIVEDLRVQESNQQLLPQAVYQAIQNENQHLIELGQPAKFVTSREGEQWGWVRLADTRGKEGDADAQGIQEAIQKHNAKIDDEIRRWLQQMDWQEFESSFLIGVLEKLGFQDVEPTQQTRDGGVDARLRYKRGLVEARALVQAKHWQKGASVPKDEIQKLRGIKGDEDTAIILTTGAFSRDAMEEAKPSQNQRIVYLIDGKALIDVCKRYKIGVRAIALPDLLILEPETGEQDSPKRAIAPNGQSGYATGDSEQPEISGQHRFRDEMLGDPQRGLSVDEVADLTDLSPNTVRAYLSDERRKKLGDKIRSSPEARDKALRIVRGRRSQMNTAD